MLYSAVAQAGFVALVAATLFTAAAGDRWGRLSAALHATNWVLVAAFMRRHVHQVFQSADFAIDVIGAVLAVVVAVMSRRGWALALAAFQVLGATTYLTALTPGGDFRQAAITASYLWELGALASLVAAGVDGWRRRVRQRQLPERQASAHS